MDKLIERCLINHFAGRHGDILAQSKCIRIGVAELAAAHIGQKVLHAFYQILTVGFECALHHYGVEEGEIGRAYCLR